MTVRIQAQLEKQPVPSLLERPLLGAAFTLTVAVLVGNLVTPGYWARAEAAARDASVLETFVGARHQVRADLERLGPLRPQRL